MLADYRITIKNNNTNEIHKLELIRMPSQKKYWIRFNGKDSKIEPCATLSTITGNIRKLIKLMNQNERK